MDQKLTRTKVWLLVLGGYFIFFLFKLFSLASDPKFRLGNFGEIVGISVLKNRVTWFYAFNSTLFVIPFVLVILLIVMIFGVNRTVTAFSKFIPRPFSHLLLPPIEAEELEEPEIHNTVTYDEENLKTLGYKLHLDYHESVKRAYNHIILQYSRSFYFSLMFAVFGFCLIAYALIFKIQANPNWPAVFVSAVIQSVPALFFYLSDRARRQMTLVFGDLRKDNEVSRAYVTCNPPYFRSGH
jgi:hypothetical protein